MSGRQRNEDKKAMKSDDVVKPGRGRPRRSPTKRDRTPSPGRPKRTTKSPAKIAGSKSPARKVEKKSPSRATPPRRKSPARVSPARVVVKVTTSTPIVEIDSDSDTETKIPKPKFQIRGRPRLVKSETPIRVAENSYLETLKPRTRLSASRESERIIPLKEDYVIAQENKLTEFSDEDEIVMKKIEVEPPKIRLKSMFRTEYGGLCGSLFFINFIPIMTVVIVFFSEKKSGYSLERFMKLSTYYDLYSYVGVFTFFLANFIFAKFPFGAKPEGQLKAFSTSSYVANGWFSLVSSYAVWCGLELYYDIPISGYVYDHFGHITVGALLFGFVLSVLLYIQSSYVPVGSLNPMGNTNNEIYDFFVGRQVAPSVFGVHMKVFLIRTVSIAKSIFIIILLAKSLNISKPYVQYIDPTALESLNVDPTMIAVCTMIYTTVIDMIYFEETLASTFELRHEGQGYLCNMQFIASAFLYPMIAKYVYDHNVTFGLGTVAALSAVFLWAAMLNRASLYQKYAFRVNPFNPKVSKYVSIPTSKGRKLLAGGLWGLRMRHPNYLAEIIMNMCLATFVWKTPVIVYIGYVTVMLLYRATRVEYRMKQKYETAWDRYCQQVKYMIIPKVY